MSKFSKISTKFRGILTVLALTAITFTVTSCKGKEPTKIDLKENYLTVDGYSVTNGEVWEELQWDASALFDDKAKEAVVKTQFDEIAKVMSDSAFENEEERKTHEYFTKRLQNYLVEAVYGFDFSLEDHTEELEKLDKKVKETKIKQFADNIYKLYDVKLTQKQIITALENDDFNALSELYSLYYLPFATERFALTKLEEEIEKKNKEHAEDKDEDTIGYFSKSEVVSTYKKNYLNQGDATAVAIKFASQAEADATLKAFGIKLNKGNFCFLKNTPKNFVEYKKYYDNFDFNEAKEEDYVDLSATYGDAPVLQLYIAMYNYVFTYHKQPLENIDVLNAQVHQTNNNGLDLLDQHLDQRATTSNLLKFYDNLLDEGKYSPDKQEDRITEIVNAIKEDEGNSKLITFEAEEISSDLYDLIYNSLQTPKQDTKGAFDRYSTSTRNVDGGYYMVFKVDQVAMPNDEIYEKNITEDDLYEKIKDKKDNGETVLYNNIIQDLKDEDLTSDYISGKVTEAMKDVKVKIFDKEIEISYAQGHSDYTKTLSGAPDNNTIAEFKYNDTVVKYELTTEDGKGLWDILEHREGTSTAIEIAQTKKIKDSKEYKEIKDEEMDLYQESLEYILASFANGGLAQQGYPAELGKYNFLMLYYHTADIDKIIDDIFKVANASAIILNRYADEDVNKFFLDYSTRAYDKYFSLTAKKVNLFLDIDEDGKADDIEGWKNSKITFDGEQTTMFNVAKELYSDIYERILASNDDHATALQKVVDEYNASGRANPAEGDRFDNNNNNYDPIPTEWAYAKYKKLGFHISIEDITVTNSDSDKDVKIKDKFNEVYNSEDFGHKEFFPSKYLENPEKSGSLIEVENNINYFVFTGATKRASAKYEEFKDINGVYKNMYYMYNEKVQKVENIYNTNDCVNENQIKAFVFESLINQSSSLLPQEITPALQAFVSPVISRYQSEATQQHISINYIANGNTNNLTFKDTDNLARYIELQEIARRVADGYTTFDEKYDNYHGWFEKVDELYNKGGNK